VACFEQGHRPLAQEGEASSPGEQELAGLAGRIHRPPHQVPQRRRHLPFIKQPGPRPRQRQGRIHRQRLQLPIQDALSVLSHRAADAGNAAGLMLLLPRWRRHRGLQEGHRESSAAPFGDHGASSPRPLPAPRA